jgi:tetratricopeptide (TPR) repeat protein
MPGDTGARCDHPGLLAALDNEAEFVYVMGHEMGHVSARHSARQMTYSMLGQFLLAGAAVAMAGSEYSDAALTLGSAGAGLILLKFSRNDELEADRLGVQYMTRLGYDPRGALSAHRNLEKVSDQYARSIGQSRQESSFFSDLLSSHPRTSIRVEEIQSIINQTPRAAISGDGTARQRFQGAVASIRRVNAVYVNYYDKAVRSLEKNNTAEALSFVRQAIAQDPGQAPFYALYGSILVKQNNLPEAERYFSRALGIDGNYQPALRGMGAIRYAGNRYAESVQYLQRSLKLFPQDPASNYFMGMNYYRTRSYKYALAISSPSRSPCRSIPGSMPSWGSAMRLWATISQHTASITCSSRSPRTTMRVVSRAHAPRPLRCSSHPKSKDRSRFQVQSSRFKEAAAFVSSLKRETWNLEWSFRFSVSYLPFVRRRLFCLRVCLRRPCGCRT